MSQGLSFGRISRGYDKYKEFGVIWMDLGPLSMSSGFTRNIDSS